MEQAMQAIAERPEAAERQPALTLMPATFCTEIETVVATSAIT
jgi:hypothetical protein